MDEAKQLVVNTVTWNHQSYLPQFFSSLDAQSFTDFTVTVVDNASTDGAVRWIQSERPNVAVLRNFRNQGIARACNQSIALARSRWPAETWASRYVLFASPECEFDRECLSAFIRAFESRPDLAVAVPKILRAVARVGEDDQRETEHTSVIDSVGVRMTRSRTALLRGAGETDHGQYDAPTSVFGFSGHCVMIRLSALIAMHIGEQEWFDEAFETEYEDADLSWRMRRAGLEIVTVPTAVVWRHSGQRASSSSSARDERRRARNRVWMIWANDEWGNWIIHVPWMWSAAFLRWMTWPFRMAWVRGRFAAWMGIGAALRKRAATKASVCVRGREMRRWFVS